MHHDPDCDSHTGNRGGRIAQLAEQLTLNQRVQGSSPCAPTNPPLYINDVGGFLFSRAAAIWFRYRIGTKFLPIQNHSGSPLTLHLPERPSASDRSDGGWRRRQQQSDPPLRRRYRHQSGQSFTPRPKASAVRLLKGLPRGGRRPLQPAGQPRGERVAPRAGPPMDYGDNSVWNNIPLACCSSVFTATKRIGGNNPSPRRARTVRSRGPIGDRPRKPPSRPLSAAEKRESPAVSRGSTSYGTRWSRPPVRRETESCVSPTRPRRW